MSVSILGTHEDSPIHLERAKSSSSMTKNLLNGPNLKCLVEGRNIDQYKPHVLSVDTQFWPSPIEINSWAS